MNPEKALVLAREAARCLGGEQQEAIEYVCRMAERGRRSSQAVAVEHFRNSTKILQDGEEKTHDDDADDT